MSGTNTGRSPRSGPEWIREAERRLKALENPTSARIGGWAINEIDGDLVATKPGRDPVVLTAQAEADVTAARTRVTKVITITGGPTGGTWSFRWRDAPSVDIAYNASAATLKAAFIALASPSDALDIDVTGTNGGPYTVVFPGGTLTADGSDLTGGTTPSVLIT